MEKNEYPNRFRVWLLVEAGDPGYFAEQILAFDPGYTVDKEEKSKYTDFVVVRADEVLGLYGGPHNLVVQIDAASEEVFGEHLPKIKELVSGAPLQVYRVVKHHPVPSYLAHGYVSEEEARWAEENGYLPPDEVGRIFRNSPGDNPWG